MTGIYKTGSARPLNRSLPDPHNAELDEKFRKPCPDCKQFHLRPGYCQARDEINRDKYLDIWGAGK
jgi:hypothetical protein